MKEKVSGERTTDVDGFLVVTTMPDLDRDYGEKTTGAADDAHLVYSIDKIRRKLEDYLLEKDCQDY